MTDARLLFAGVPHTGKSTFLALLNLAITSGARVSLSLGHFQDDREYLNGLTARLMSCEPADRTLLSQSDGLSLSLRTATSQDISLSIPDLSGETWADVLAERVCADTLIDQIEDALGICVFVHASDFTTDPTIAEVHRAANALGESADEYTADAHQGYLGDARTSQIDLVDLLQILGSQFAPRPKRVALVISAFDVANGQSPVEWLEQNAPFAEQYLRSNLDSTAIRVFGLSAQGGRFDDKDELKALRKRDPLERAFVLGHDGARLELDAPIVWALGID
ncbi:hypothetical protein ITJ43_13395 [Microbacterium sp. VKM Ac-2870]|uniref:TRAFAC clade GTPase domain-containing protein n=1 Tax=Microbacterium sp. VKM Ac-2870 TaxID=2783825 RepID=UPI00188C6B7A|nr:hypothetical protein [Microbacterium sp. VKM Ac-2870]MBF4563127.1 hypothetical protein [Microbacterium sp. VKM Ac-2870]